MKHTERQVDIRNTYEYNRCLEKPECKRQIERPNVNGTECERNKKLR